MGTATDLQLVSLVSVESAWARLSHSPDYQRHVTTYFKNNTFCVNRAGLYAGTDKSSGRRQIYCDSACTERLAEELAAIVGAGLEAGLRATATPEDEPLDVQPLSFQSVEDVKSFLKELKRSARQARQGRQLSAAQTLLLNARRWTAPFRPAPEPAPGPPEPQCPDTSVVDDGVKGTTAAQGCGGSSNSSSSDGGGGGGGGCSRGRGGEGAAAGGEGPQVAASCRSHPVGGVAAWADAEDGEGRTAEVGGGPALDAAAASISRHLETQDAGPADAVDQAHKATCVTAELQAASAVTANGGVSVTDSNGLCAAMRLLHCHTHAAATHSQPAPAAAVAAAAAAVCGGAGTPSPSCSGPTSLADSGAPTPAWPPATPRFAAGATGHRYAAAAAAANGTAVHSGDSDIDAGGATPSEAHTVATVAAAAAWRPGQGGGGGGAEGVLVVCCSIDLEWWERDSSRVTEIGWTMWDNLTQRLVSRHHIVSEHEALINRIHVPDHKHNFLFGASSNGPLAGGAAALQADLDSYGQRLWAEWCRERQQEQLLQQGQGERDPGCGSGDLPPRPPPVQLVLVGHGMSGDLKALSTLLGVAVPAGAAIVDTADLAWAALGGGAGQERNPISLRLLLKTLDINATKLHNGGNDARYTMEAMLALAALEASPAE